MVPSIANEEAAKVEKGPHLFRFPRHSTTWLILLWVLAAMLWLNSCTNVWSQGFPLYFKSMRLITVVQAKNLPWWEDPPWDYLALATDVFCALVALFAAKLLCQHIFEPRKYFGLRSTFQIRLGTWIVLVLLASAFLGLNLWAREGEFRTFLGVTTGVGVRGFPAVVSYGYEWGELHGMGVSSWFNAVTNCVFALAVMGTVGYAMETLFRKDTRNKTP